MRENLYLDEKRFLLLCEKNKHIKAFHFDRKVRSLKAKWFVNNVALYHVMMEEQCSNQCLLYPAYWRYSQSLGENYQEQAQGDTEDTSAGDCDLC